MYTSKRNFEEGLLSVLDALCIVVSMIAARLLRYGGQSGEYDLGLYVSIAITCYFVVRLFQPSAKMFSQRGYFQELARVLQLHLFMFLVMVAFLYISHRGGDFPRLLSGYFYAIDICVMYAVRSLLKYYLFQKYRTGKSSRRLLVVTDSAQADGVVRALQTDRMWDTFLSGVVVVDRDMAGGSIQNLEVVCNMDGLIPYIKDHPVDEVFIKVDSRIPISMKSLLERLEAMGVIVDLNIQAFDMNIHAEKTLDQIGPYPVVTFARKLLGYRDRVLKRTMDIAGGLTGMLILAVVSVFVVPAIKLDSPGPVFFTQVRVGKNGRLFKLFKFRSMYRDAEQRKKELMQQNEMKGLMFKMENDPRITRVGRFIRRTSIDELPQFWNVLKGDMSLVGTRPPTLDEYEQYKPEYKSRLSMRPGISGLWQVSGRSAITDFEDVMALDMKYIDNWSLMGDIKILFRTLYVVLFQRGAE